MPDPASLALALALALPLAGASPEPAGKRVSIARMALKMGRDFGDGV